MVLRWLEAWLAAGAHSAGRHRDFTTAEMALLRSLIASPSAISRRPHRLDRTVTRGVRGLRIRGFRGFADFAEAIG